MKGGIPQGSALGPLLFLIYMNTLPSTITSGLLLQCADDTTLICAGPSPDAAAELMNQQLALIQDWLVHYKLSLNIQKSRVLWFHIGKRKRHLLQNLIFSQTLATLAFRAVRWAMDSGSQPFSCFCTDATPCVLLSVYSWFFFQMDIFRPYHSWSC